MSNIVSLSTGLVARGGFLAAGLLAAVGGAQAASRHGEPLQPHIQTASHATSTCGLKFVRIKSADTVLPEGLSFVVADSFQVLVANQVDLDPEIAQATAKGFWSMFEG